MKIKVLTFFVVSLFYVGCNNNELNYIKPNFELQPSSNFNQNEIEIFQKLFGEKELVVSQKTLANFKPSFSNDFYTKKGVFNLMEKYKTINKESYYFEYSMYTANKNVKIVPFNEIDFFFSVPKNIEFFEDVFKNNEHKFNRFYPNTEGIYSFSRIVFNEENTKCFFMYQLITAYGGNHGSIFGEIINNEWTFTQQSEVIYN